MIIEDCDDDNTSPNDSSSEWSSLYTEISEYEMQMLEEKENAMLFELEKDSQTFYQIRQVIKNAYKIDIEKDIQHCRDLMQKNREKLRKA